MNLTLSIIVAIIIITSAVFLDDGEPFLSYIKPVYTMSRKKTQ